ncbi:MAG TPA: hypothetical protein VG269_26150 [Tepidisphaeraceae bacterium]|jgi:Tfp pilus assembly protein PilF|nr:hypothetical protein [Tepidisphaeraceae bacterium]
MTTATTLAGRRFLSPAERRRDRLLGLLLAGLTGLVFLPALAAEFLDWDDRDTVAQNADYLPPRVENWGHYWVRPHLELYMPLTYTVWGAVACVAQVRGADGSVSLNPTVFHLFNVGLHVLNAVLVYAILRRLVQKPWAAWFGALLFAIHPLHVEPVAWVTAMSMLLSSAFSLWALWEFLRFEDLRAAGVQSDGAAPAGKQSARGKAWLHYGLATVAFALALLSRPSAVMLPVVVGVIEVWLRRRRLRDVALPLALWLLLCVPVALVTRAVQPAQLVTVAPGLRPLVALDALSFYLWKTFIPLRLLPDYGRTPGWLAAHPGMLRFTWIGAVCVALLCLMLWRRWRWPAVAFAVFALSLLPVLGLTVFAYQRFSTVADRYAYLALLGPAIGVACILATRPSRPKFIVAAAVAVVFASLSFWQTRYWSDTAILFEHTLEVSPDSWEAHYALGHYYGEKAQEELASGNAEIAQSRFEQALAHDRAALATHPDDVKTRFNTANLLLRFGHNGEAVDDYRRALSDRTFAKEMGPRAYNNLGIALAKSSQGDQAADAFRESLRLDPTFEQARANLARAVARRGQPHP